MNVSSRRFELQAYVDVINTADAFKLSRLSKYLCIHTQYIVCAHTTHFSHFCMAESLYETTQTTLCICVRSRVYVEQRYHIIIFDSFILLKCINNILRFNVYTMHMYHLIMPKSLYLFSVYYFNQRTKYNGVHSHHVFSSITQYLRKCARQSNDTATKVFESEAVCFTC